MFEERPHDAQRSGEAVQFSVELFELAVVEAYASYGPLCWKQVGELANDGVEEGYNCRATVVQSGSAVTPGEAVSGFAEVRNARELGVHDLIDGCHCYLGERGNARQRGAFDPHHPRLSVEDPSPECGIHLLGDHGLLSAEIIYVELCVTLNVDSESFRVLLDSLAVGDGLCRAQE